MDNSERNEQVLLKQCVGGWSAPIARLQNILTLAPIGLKATRRVRDERAFGEGPDKETRDFGYHRGDVIPPRHDELGEKPGDSKEAKLDKETRRALRDRNIAASEAYQMEVETAQLIRSVEDMLSFNRALKEAWLFGKLDTLGQSDAEKRAEEHAQVVADLLPKVMNSVEHESNGSE